MISSKNILSSANNETRKFIYRRRKIRCDVLLLTLLIFYNRGACSGTLIGNDSDFLTWIREIEGDTAISAFAECWRARCNETCLRSVSSVARSTGTDRSKWRTCSSEVHNFTPSWSINEDDVFIPRVKEIQECKSAAKTSFVVLLGEK